MVTTPIGDQFEHWDADTRHAHPRGFLLVSADGRIAAANGTTHELLGCKTEDELRRLLEPALTRLNSLPQAPDVPHRFELHAAGSPQGSPVAALAQRLGGEEFRWLVMLQPAASSRASVDSLQHAWRNQLMQRLYGTMRHDLNSPIQAALWTFDLLRRAVQQSQLTAEQRSQLEESTALGRKELARLKTAVQRFLAFAAPEAGAPERIDAGALLEDVQRLIAAEASLADVKLNVALPSQPVAIEAVRAPLEQALIMMLLAVLDTTAQGGEVNTTICEVEGEVQIVISGAPPRAASEAGMGGMERAHNGRSWSDTDLDGVRASVRSHGGDIDERSRNNRREFHLRWPRFSRRL